MPSDDFIIVKKSGSQAGIEPITFGELAHCSNQLSYGGPSWPSGHNSTVVKLYLTDSIDSCVDDRGGETECLK